MNKVKVLLVGPRGVVIGGDTIPFRNLESSLLKRPDIEVRVLDTYGIRGSGWRALPRFMGLVLQMFRLAHWCDVISLHANPTGVPFVGPFLVFAARFWRRPIIFRQFGGSYYTDFPAAQAAAIRWFVKECYLYLVETKELKRQAEEDGFRHVKWYPNSRLRPSSRSTLLDPVECSGRFIFVGRLQVDKGLKVLVEAVEAGEVEMRVDVYGPWEDLPRNTFDGCKRVVHKGELAPDDVIPTIEKYDALIMPTLYETEVYPGVILEAYHAGRPVIASRWRVADEIVFQDETGILVAPRKAVPLREAMVRLMQSPDLYRKLARGARAFGGQFSVDALADAFITLCRESATRSSRRSTAQGRDAMAGGVPASSQ